MNKKKQLTYGTMHNFGKVNSDFNNYIKRNYKLHINQAFYFKKIWKLMHFIMNDLLMPKPKIISNKCIQCNTRNDKMKKKKK